MKKKFPIIALIFLIATLAIATTAGAWNDAVQFRYNAYINACGVEREAHNAYTNACDAETYANSAYQRISKASHQNWNPTNDRDTGIAYNRMMDARRAKNAAYSNWMAAKQAKNNAYNDYVDARNANR